MTKPRKKRWLYAAAGLLLVVAACSIILLKPSNFVAKLLQPWRDWPQISVYSEANARLRAAPAEGGRVVFFGDSHTARMNLAGLFPGKPYVNRGIGGQNTAQMLVRFRPDVIALRPGVVVILGGTNDVVRNYRKLPFEQTVDNYASMAELAVFNKIKVVFASVPPVNDYRGTKWASRLDPPDRILKLNEWLKSYCAANGHVYLDYYTRLADEKGMLKAELSDDGLHLNAAGYRAVAELADAAVRSAGAEAGEN